MDAATTRTIHIGATNIGLVGLDIALNKATAEAMPEDEAVAFIFSVIGQRNYIPPGAEDNYREALRVAYRQHMNIETPQVAGLVIRIFGTGCISCDKLQGQVIEVLDNMNLAADIEQIHDPDEIGRHGILMTPALMINGQVKSGGKPPTPVQIEQWITEASQDG